MSHSTTPDYYELLGVPRDADTEAITRAYRRLARVSHPDAGGNDGMFRLLRTAYETLTDDAGRRAYDAGLDRGEPSPAPERDEPAPTDSEGPVRSIIVDPELLSWWGRAGLERQPRVYPPYRQGLWAAGTAVAAFAVVTAVLAVLQPTAGVGLFAGGVALGVTYLRAYRGVDITVVGVVAGALAVLADGVAMYFVRPRPVALLGFAVLITLAVAAVLVHRYATGARLDRQAPPTAVAQVEYGRPGDGRQLAEQDRLADRVGADALLPLTQLPGARIIHCVDDIDGEALVSHAVVCGRQVALVESKYWEPGSYAWTPHGALLRDGHHFPAGETGLETTVAAYSRLLGDGVAVRGFIQVTVTHPGDVTGGLGPTGLMIGDPQAVVDEIGRWFLDEGIPDAIDRNLLVQVYGHRATEGVEE